MRKALICEGDRTTTGGIVLKGSAHGMKDDGRTFALHGDGATCGSCEGIFRIFGTATERRYDGRPGVIEGDRVLCPCGRNRVMASPNAGCFYEDSGGVGAATKAMSAMQTSGSVTHISWAYVHDSETGEPLRNRDFVAHIAGAKQFGKTDGDGYAKIVTNGQHSFAIHAIFESPRRALKPQQGN